MFHFTELLGVSRGTINEDLKKLEKYLEDYSLKLVYSRLKGYYIEGKESIIKYVAMLLIIKLISNNHSRYIFELVLREEGLYIFNKLTSVCKEKFNDFNMSFSDNSLLEVTYIATFVLMRSQEMEEEFFKEKNFIFTRHVEYNCKAPHCSI